jgi:hypothetical protein
MINFNEINQEELEIAADKYYGVMLNYFHEQEEKTRKWMIEKIHEGVKLGGVNSQQGG